MSESVSPEPAVDRAGDWPRVLICANRTVREQYRAGEVLARLEQIGELDGDRFANRIDVAAAAARGIRVVTGRIDCHPGGADLVVATPRAPRAC
ncbi:MAG: hypothetical protein M3O34_14130 [Chloroflexota bacterium]|nr:hypothetical protein [Chloroflexota bacterium]